MYHQIDLPHEGKWSYRMSPSADDKKYATDTRTFKDAVLQDGIFEHFDESPISQHLLIKDICIYKPGDLNKNGKEGKTSWDSFSYALMMGHNVWTHIESVQRANREFDSGNYPSMMKYSGPEQEKFQDIIESIFSANTKQESLDIIEHYTKYWMEIIGTRGNKGKKTLNSETKAEEHFEFEGSIKLEKIKKEKSKPQIYLDIFGDTI
jgi:hypothetical protein